MKNKLTVFLVLMIALVSTLGFAACNEKPSAVKYDVTYEATGLVGSAPATQSYEEGARVTLAQNPFSKEGFFFDGWQIGTTVYAEGDAFVMPGENVTVTATWVEGVSVVWLSGGGTGTDPVTQLCKPGSALTLPQNPYTKEGYVFDGWQIGSDTYDEGAIYTIPAEDVTVTATWVEEPSEPSFGAQAYTYDRFAAGDLEITFDADGASVMYVDLDATQLKSSEWTYDSQTGCIVIDEEVVLALPDGTYTISVWTDSELGTLSTTLTVDNSVKTGFDETTTKHFRFGYDEGVTFTVDFNGTTVKALTVEGTTVPTEYYTVGASGITILSEWLARFAGETDYKLTLSNNDSYDFSVTSTVVFATDYDYVTEHDTTESNTGINPLYQYYDNVSIVAGPSQMTGNVLKITPNTTEVQYDCNGYITLASEEYRSQTTWRCVGFVPEKVYFIAFDYMTEGTSGGTFAIRDPRSNWSHDLLKGAEKDGIPHRFEGIYTGDDIKHGIYIYANFIGGGGVVYVDNFMVAEIDAVPTIAIGAAEYVEGDLALTVDAKGLSYVLALDETVLDAEDLIVDGTAVKIKGSALEALDFGAHTVSMFTPAGKYVASFRKIDTRVAELTVDTVSYHFETDASVSLAASVTDGLTLTGLYQLDKNYNGGFEGGWDFAHGNLEKDYAEYATLTTGLDGTGKLELSKEFLDLFWGDTQFVVSFSNGKSDTFTLRSDVLMFTDYDNTTIHGYLNDVFRSESPLTSGLGQVDGRLTIDEVDGDNALVIHSTDGAADRAAFNVRFHPHAWSWYTVPVEAGSYTRITFDYKLDERFNDGDVYLYIMHHPDDTFESTEDNFFGEYDEKVVLSGWKEVRWNLIADGQTHTFDSGWFRQSVLTGDALLRMAKIQLPEFTASENKTIVFDNYRIIARNEMTNPVKDLGDFAKGDEAFGFALGGHTLSSITLDGEPFTAYTENDGAIRFDVSILNKMECKQYALVVYTNEGRFIKSFAITDNRVAALTQTARDVVYGEGSVFLSGEFDASLVATRLVRYGGDPTWDNGGQPVEMKADYVTVAADGIELAAAFVDQVYDTCRYEVTFDNGKTVSFALTSNVGYFSNYDETNVYVAIPGNSVISQDRALHERVEIDGNGMLKYTPSNAVEGHAVNAINGSGQDNYVFTFKNGRNNNNDNWYADLFESNAVVAFFFDYDITVGEGKASPFQVRWSVLEEGQPVFHVQALSGKGSFYQEFAANTLCTFGINAPAATPADVEGAYMLIDSIGYARVTDPYLVEYQKTAVYGEEGDVTFRAIEGKLNSEITVTAATRFGEFVDWDTSLRTPAAISPAYFTVSAEGITVARELVDKLYRTSFLALTLSNGDTVRIRLTTNAVYADTYDEVDTTIRVIGNGPNCQDSEMMEVVDVDGNKMLKYTPAKATQGHAVNANSGLGYDNGVFTFANSSVWNGWFGHAFAADDVVTVAFDYEIELGDKTQSYYHFSWYDRAGPGAAYIHCMPLSGKGRFETQLAASSVSGFLINCPTPSGESNEGTYMLIDNLTVVASKNAQAVTYGETEDITLQAHAGMSFEGLTLTSVRRFGLDEYDHCYQTPSMLDLESFELTENGLTVKRALLDQLYGLTTLEVTLSDGSVTTFCLKSNMVYFSNYDDVLVSQPFNGGANGWMSQDDSTLSLAAEGIDGTSLRYCIADAKGLATQAHNFVMIFRFVWGGLGYYKSFDFDPAYDYVVSFDYRVVNGDGAECTYDFLVGDSADAWTRHDLDAAQSSFTMTLNGGSASHASTAISSDQLNNGASNVAGCYLLIDNYRVVQIAKA